MTVSLTVGDCIEQLSKLADRSLDHVITDPPYSDWVHKRSSTPRAGRKLGRRMRHLGFESMSCELRARLATELARLVRRWVLVFTDGESNHLWRDALTSAGLEYVRTCYWHKLGGTPQLTGDRPADHIEHIVVCHQRHPNGKPMRKRWHGRGRGNLYSVPIVRDSHREPRVHTTQKPLALMEALVRDFTGAGDRIGDPFAGSGTTLVAAKRFGRVAFGVEANSPIANIAARRVSLARVQTELFPADNSHLGQD